jgi:hypothetical protein
VVHLSCAIVVVLGVATFRNRGAIFCGFYANWTIFGASARVLAGLIALFVVVNAIRPIWRLSYTHIDRIATHNLLTLFPADGIVFVAHVALPSLFSRSLTISTLLETPKKTRGFTRETTVMIGDLLADRKK